MPDPEPVKLAVAVSTNYGGEEEAQWSHEDPVDIEYLLASAYSDEEVSFPIGKDD